MTYKGAEHKRQQRWARAATRELIDGRLVATEANEHGTCSTYGNWQCRCEPCTEAHTVQHQSWRAKRHAQRELIDGVWIAVNAHRHNAATYVNWGCRCPECTTAFSADCAYLKQRREAKA